MIVDKPTYSITEAAAYLQMSETCLSELVKSGEIRASKPGMHYVLRRSVLDAYLEQLEEEQTAKRREAFAEGRKPHIPTVVSIVRKKRKEIPKLPELPEASSKVAAA